MTIAQLTAEVERLKVQLDLLADWDVRKDPAGGWYIMGLYSQLAPYATRDEAFAALLAYLKHRKKTEGGAKVTGD